LKKLGSLRPLAGNPGPAARFRPVDTALNRALVVAALALLPPSAALTGLRRGRGAVDRLFFKLRKSTL
jgi:hypothetical protein